MAKIVKSMVRTGVATAMAGMRPATAAAAALALSALLAAPYPTASAHEPGTAEATLETGAALQSVAGQIYASPAQVQQIQKKLLEQGYDLGQADGSWGERTRAAVRDFQRAKGLAPTGQLDTSLLSALDMGSVLEGETQTSFLDGLLSEDRPRAGAVQGTGAPVYVSPMHVAQIQFLLRENGHDPGTIDGQWGAGTTQAAQEFRQSAGLEASDGLDVALLQALNRQRVNVPEQHLSSAKQHTSGVPLHVGPAVLREMQRELAQRGHEAGSLDGEWGTNTQQAVREFQRSENLEPTGTLTLPTLAALDIDVTQASRAAIPERAADRAQPQAEEADAVAARDEDEEPARNE